ncbi:hypothetical protein KQX54_001890 [Cotesia glomerata]|uniref:Uncharacterized protein n=1 Tax=Cotesia glomerata TaxID=32391 RepID=A0AAV7I4M2_COTGL|nr:hypothetical protein KQX54_001890 [Cotesia glomerata]
MYQVHASSSSDPRRHVLSYVYTEPSGVADLGQENSSAKHVLNLWFERYQQLTTRITWNKRAGMKSGNPVCTVAAWFYTYFSGIASIYVCREQRGDDGHAAMRVYGRLVGGQTEWKTDGPFLYLYYLPGWVQVPTAVSDRSRSNPCCADGDCIWFSWSTQQLNVQQNIMLNPLLVAQNTDYCWRLRIASE